MNKNERLTHTQNSIASGHFDPISSMEETKCDIQLSKTGSESPGQVDPAADEQETNMAPDQHTENGMSLLSH